MVDSWSVINKSEVLGMSLVNNLDKEFERARGMGASRILGLEQTDAVVCKLIFYESIQALEMFQFKVLTDHKGPSDEAKDNEDDEDKLSCKIRLGKVSVKRRCRMSN